MRRSHAERVAAPTGACWRLPWPWHRSTHAPDDVAALPTTTRHAERTDPEARGRPQAAAPDAGGAIPAGGGDGGPRAASRGHPERGTATGASLSRADEGKDKDKDLGRLARWPGLHARRYPIRHPRHQRVRRRPLLNHLPPQPDFETHLGEERDINTRNHFYFHRVLDPAARMDVLGEAQVRPHVLDREPDPRHR